jgi:hypothetical protein
VLHSDNITESLVADNSKLNSLGLIIENHFDANLLSVIANTKIN